MIFYVQYVDMYIVLGECISKNNICSRVMVYLRVEMLLEDPPNPPYMG